MKRYVSILIVILTILVVFFLPFGVQIDLAPQGPDSLISIVWEIQFWQIPFERYSIRYFSSIQYYFEYCFFRFFFLIGVALLLIGKYNKILFVLIGIISELIPLMISIPAMYILNSHGDNLIPIVFPIPFLLIFDLILVKLANRLGVNPSKK